MKNTPYIKLARKFLKDLPPSLVSKYQMEEVTEATLAIFKEHRPSEDEVENQWRWRELPDEDDALDLMGCHMSEGSPVLSYIDFERLYADLKQDYNGQFEVVLHDKLWIDRL